MASSSQRSTSRAPPPRDQLASFYKLVDKDVIAGALSRHARNAELSAQAAMQAEALFGGDSLVVASLRQRESESLPFLGVAARGAEQKALLRKSWEVLLSILPLLLRRLAANTLLPATIRDEELDYEAHVQATSAKALSRPVPFPTQLRTWATTMGYDAILNAMVKGLDLLLLPFLPAAQTRIMESFVLQGLDVIPRTAGISAQLIAAEVDLVAKIERRMNPRDHKPTFCAAVLQKWRSEAVSSVLQARGTLQTGIAQHMQNQAAFHARKHADIAQHGLRDCALPSCVKKETTVKKFAGCSGCRSVVYCCLEHQGLDWKAHKKACREKEAAQAAEDEGTAPGVATEASRAFGRLGLD